MVKEKLLYYVMSVIVEIGCVVVGVVFGDVKISVGCCDVISSINFVIWLMVLVVVLL